MVCFKLFHSLDIHWYNFFDFLFCYEEKFSHRPRKLGFKETIVVEDRINFNQLTSLLNAVSVFEPKPQLKTSTNSELLPN